MPLAPKRIPAASQSSCKVDLLCQLLDDWCNGPLPIGQELKDRVSLASHPDEYGAPVGEERLSKHMGGTKYLEGLPKRHSDLLERNAGVEKPLYKQEVDEI